MVVQIVGARSTVCMSVIMSFNTYIIVYFRLPYAGVHGQFIKGLKARVSLSNLQKMSGLGRSQTG